MIVVFGSVNVDITAYSAQLPRAGKTIHASHYITGLGGKGANQAAAAARLGAKTCLIGRTGMDGFAETARSALTKFGVDLSELRTTADFGTGIAIIAVDAHGENTITVIGGANLSLTPADAEASRAVLEQASVLLLQNEIPAEAACAAARIAAAAGATIILDPAPAPGSMSTALKDLCRYADIITPNETETEALTGLRPESPEQTQRAAERLRDLGARAAILKLGNRGAVLSTRSDTRVIPPFTVTSCDSVAAGDCFNGALAVALSEGRSLPEAVRFASGAGALSTTRYGAAASAPGRAELDGLLLANPAASV